MIYDNILQTIGRTPVIKINNLAPSHSNMYVKVEAFNPMASVKDRLAYSVILDAEKRGLLTKGQTVIEATSGNTGIALAMVCAVRGYPFVAVMADSFSVERRKLIRALGAKVILTPAAERGKGMVQKAEQLSAEHGWFLANQFENEANPAFHRNTTGPEILSDFADKNLDYWVSGYGTGGTITGTGEVLKLARPDIKIIATEPEGAAALLQNKDWQGESWQPHKIQGWTPDFVPNVFNREIFDDVISVSDDDAKIVALQLAQKEGIFCGLSAGATFASALKVAETAPEGSTILAMLPDTGERYLSTYLFDDIAEGSDDEWLESL
ncbi:MAG: cysteine synthase A [Gammaproteobacteria bacterium]|nr:MAG: cysteine synthase A [Gammaproteobacteria bacterium]